MNESGGGCLGLIFLLIIGWFVYNHYQEKVQESYNYGYGDGFDNGLESISREDITIEEVENDPYTYCSDHLDRFIAELEGEFNCYKK